MTTEVTTHCLTRSENRNMDREKYVRNILLLGLLCVRVSACNLQKETCAREFDLQCITDRSRSFVTENTPPEVFISVPESGHDDAGVAARTRGRGQRSGLHVEKLVSCNSSIGNGEIRFSFNSHASTVHPTNSCASGSEPSHSQTFGQDWQEKSNSILQRDIQVFNYSAGHVFGDENILFRTVETLKRAKHNSETPLNQGSTTGEEFHRNITGCFVDLVGKIIYHQNCQAPKVKCLLEITKSKYAINKSYLDYWIKPSYFSYVENILIINRNSSGNCPSIKTGLDSVTDYAYLSQVPTISLNHRFDNFSDLKCVECPTTHMEAVVGDYELEHSKVTPKINFFHPSLTLGNDMNHVNNNRSVQLCGSEETQHIHSNNVLQYSTTKTEINAELENHFTEITSGHLFLNRTEQECVDNNDDITKHLPPFDSNSNQPSEYNLLWYNPQQGCLPMNVTTQCAPSDQVLEDTSDIPNHTYNLDQCCKNCEQILPWYFNLDQSLNRTIQSPDLFYSLVRRPSHSEVDDLLTSLPNVQSSGKINESTIMECPNNDPSNPDVNTFTHQTEEGSSNFLYTCGKQSKFIQTQVKTSSFPANKFAVYVYVNPNNDGSSPTNSSEQCENPILTQGHSHKKRGSDSQAPEQICSQKDNSVDEKRDKSQGNKIPAAGGKTTGELIEDDGEIADLSRDEVRHDVGMVWPLKVLVYSCSVLVIVWSFYGAAHLYRFYLEQHRMLSPRTPTNSYQSSAFPFHSDSMQAIVDAIKGDRAAATTASGVFPTTPNCSPIKPPRCSTPKPLCVKFQQLLHADHCLGDRVELYAADNIRSMVRYDPGLGMKLWPHFKHNTRRYVGRTVQDRKITQYAEKKLQSRMLTDFAFQEDVFGYIEKHVWPEVRRQARMSIGDWEHGRLDLRSREVMRAEALSYLTARFSTILWHDGLLEREIMSHVERSRHSSMHHLH